MGIRNRFVNMIKYLKDKYYWWNVHNKLKSFLASYNDNKILLFGYPKSGNTWLRFLLFNYLNLLLNKTQTKTLTYEELNSIQNNIMDRESITCLIIIGFILWMSIHFYKNSDFINLTCIISESDGNKYCIRERKNSRTF